jgi:diguanylate cyclase (GGDEF)-like protein
LTIFVILSLLATLIVCAFSALQANKQSLTESYLKSNYQYAEKLSFTTRNLLQMMQQDLDVTSKQLNHHSINQVQESMDELWSSRKSLFNSMIVVDKDLVIKAITPQVAGAKTGDKLSSEAVRQAVMEKRPFISEPYHAITKKLIVLISVPVFDHSGTYQGFVGGTIYLEQNNALSRILTDNFYDNGSYVYVVDKTGNIIFHPKTVRIGDNVKKNNVVVQKVLSGNSGSQQVVNSEGHLFFAGYSHEPFSGWGIIAQTPASIVVNPAKDLVFHMIELALPSFLLIFIISLLIAVYISKPLYILAKFSEELTLQKEKINTTLPNMKSKIYEVRHLYESTKLALQQINHHIHELNIEIQTDALTGLANRRTFDLIMNQHINNHIPFSLVFLDIDYFKKVNDRFGHLIGDDLLKFLAKIMLEVSREGDLCCRYGGEEFAIIVPYGDRDIAINVAERLRMKIQHSTPPTGNPITISIGIAVYPQHGQDSKQIIARADEALYKSKAEGRNRTTFYSE